jgi:hypothetical protein
MHTQTFWFIIRLKKKTHLKSLYISSSFFARNNYSTPGIARVKTLVLLYYKKNIKINDQIKFKE